MLLAVARDAEPVHVERLGIVEVVSVDLAGCAAQLACTRPSELAGSDGPRDRNVGPVLQATLWVAFLMCQLPPPCSILFRRLMVPRPAVV